MRNGYMAFQQAHDILQAYAQEVSWLPTILESSMWHVAACGRWDPLMSVVLVQLRSNAVQALIYRQIIGLGCRHYTEVAALKRCRPQDKLRGVAIQERLHAACPARYISSGQLVRLQQPIGALAAHTHVAERYTQLMQASNFVRHCMYKRGLLQSSSV